MELIIGVLCLIIMILVFMYRFVKDDLEELDNMYDYLLEEKMGISKSLKDAYAHIRRLNEEKEKLELKLENYENNMEILSNSYNTLHQNYNMVVANLTPAKKTKLGL